MTALREPTRMTFDEYLVHPASSAFGSPFIEYVDGTVFEVPAQSQTHDSLTTHIFNQLWDSLGSSFAAQSFRPLRLQSTGGEFGYRSDVCVVHATEANLHAKYVDNPIAVVEVLSPSTQRLDRGEKRMNYTQIPSLQEYVLVSQDMPKVEIFRRAAGWTALDLYPGETLELDSVGLKLPLADIFRTITF